MQNKFMMQRRTFLMLAAAGALPLLGMARGCNRTSRYEREQIMQKIPLTPHCIGRLLLDTPVDSENYYSYQNYKGWNIEFKPNASHITLNHMMQEKEKELKEERHSTENSRYIETEKINNNLIVVTSRSDPVTVDFKQVDAFFFIDKGIFLFNSEARNSYHSNLLTELKTITLDQLKKRAQSDAPQAAGFCIDGGLIQSGSNDHESILFGGRLKQYPGVSFSIQTQALAQGDEPEESLGARVKGAMALASGLFTDLKVLRSGSKKAGGFSGEEFAYFEDGGCNFDWEHTGKPGRQEAPRIAINLEASQEAMENITQQELLALWDAMLGTLRIRPGAFS